MNEWEIRWSRNHFDLLAINATWGVPRSGLIFTKVSNKELALDSVMPWNDDIARAFRGGRDVPASEQSLLAYQRADLEAIRKRFEAAGIEVTDPKGLL